MSGAVADVVLAIDGPCLAMPEAVAIPGRPRDEVGLAAGLRALSAVVEVHRGDPFIPLGDIAIEALEEQFTGSRHRDPESIVFCHPALGTPRDPSKLTRHARKALDQAGVDASFRPWHGLRHTALTETAAAGIPGGRDSGQNTTVVER